MYISIFQLQTSTRTFYIAKASLNSEPFGLNSSWLKSGGLKCLSNYFEHEHKMYEKMGVGRGVGAQWFLDTNDGE